MILYDNGIEVNASVKGDLPDEFDPPGWFNLEFAAALLATFFWVI